MYMLRPGDGIVRKRGRGERPPDVVDFITTEASKLAETVPGFEIIVVQRRTVGVVELRSDWRLFLVHALATGALLALVGLTGVAYAVVAGWVFVTLVWSPNR